MKTNKKSLVAMFCVSLLLAFLLMPAIGAAEEKQIRGLVSDNGTIIADDGEEYIIADNDLKEVLMENTGKTVTVMGAVIEDEGEKTVSVRSYEVMED